ncbi:hypothetical protein GCM10010218_37820 [Streptomyces mashuensis]|uniref:CHAT domain-containing protein n=1 Tax=Streptomyces mashuensis TaxID=33904 RepID=A0A919B687_9ACTN|nr:CHAT domain-containing protein [Streptomyces mashuensis]GHF52803.1 hypothetical protein GCM10010218_37820 [Streptomyces mashuensis]
MTTDLELEICGTRPGEYEVRVVRAAAGGEPEAVLRLDVDALLARRAELENTVLASSVSARRVVPVAEEPVRQVGENLFTALFAGPVYGAYRASLGVAQARQERLRIALRLEAPELALLPWEALFDPETDTYLCRHEPLVRHVPAPYTPEPRQVRPPLRVLVLIASPRGLPPLDTEAERGRLEKALAGQLAAGRVELSWLPQASWDSVHARLQEGEWHVLHFIGHGDYDVTADEGLIALVDDDGGPDMVEASRLADLLGEAEPTPRLVVLNSCASARGGTKDVFSSTGAALVRSGIHAVAAMQFTVSDRAALRFAQGFYTSLAGGHRIDEAARSARIAMLGGGRQALEWLTPVLYVRGDTTRLFTFTAPPPPVTPAAAAAAAPGAGAPPPLPAEQLRAQVRTLRVMACAEMRVGHYEKAVELLDDLLTLDPGNEEAQTLRTEATGRRRLAGLRDRAAQAEAAQDWPAAVEAYVELLGENPDDKEAAARLDACRTQQRIADLRAELLYHAEAGQWRAVLDVDEELRGLDASAADPDGLATRARSELQEAERHEAEQATEAARTEPLVVPFGEQVYALSWSPDGRRLAVSGTAATARVLDAADGAELLAVQAGVVDLHWVYAVAFGPDGTRFATGSDNHWVRVWDAGSGERLLEMRHDKPVLTVAFGRDGAYVASGGLDGTARVWDAATGREVRRVHHAGAVFEVALSPDGGRLATGSQDETARLWDVATGSRLLEVHHDHAVFAVAFGPDGGRLATGSHDGTARVWDARTGEQLLVLPHDCTVFAVAFSPDGRWLATGCHDGTARVWDAVSGEPVQEVRHDDKVLVVAFSPDGTRLATGSHDRTVRVWPVAE